MATKTHIIQQDEAIEETGIQLRTDEPTTPIEDQVWLNKTDRRIKYFDGIDKVIISEGQPASLSLAGLEVDVSLSNTFFKSIDDNIALSFINFLSGLKVDIAITNTDASSHTITFPTGYEFSDGSDGEIPTGQTKVFSILATGDYKFISTKLFT